jgi:hypothetical protein
MAAVPHELVARRRPPLQHAVDEPAGVDLTAPEAGFAGLDGIGDHAAVLVTSRLFQK